MYDVHDRRDNETTMEKRKRDCEKSFDLRPVFCFPNFIYVSVCNPFLLRRFFLPFFSLSFLGYSQFVDSKKKKKEKKNLNFTYKNCASRRVRLRIISSEIISRHIRNRV